MLLLCCQMTEHPPECRSNSVGEIWKQGRSARLARSEHATQQQMQVPLSTT